MEPLKDAPRMARKVFWCPYARRMVSVEFTEVGPPLFRRQVAIRACSAFEHPSHISCHRGCLDPAFRRDSALWRSGSGTSSLW